jgi:DNA-binding transcriptional ArsR family regulator
MTLSINLISADGAETRLAVLRQLLAYAEPVTAYRVGKDLGLELNRVSPALKRLAVEGAVECVQVGETKRYAPIPCLAHYEEHLPPLLALVQDLADDNPEDEPEQLLAILTYLISLVHVEVECDPDFEVPTGQLASTTPPVD